MATVEVTRRRLMAWVLGAGLVSSPAYATVETTKGKASEPPHVSSSSPGSSSNGTAQGGGGKLNGGGEPEVGLVDYTPGNGRKLVDIGRKWFEVGVTLETHALLWRTNTNAGNRKFFNYGFAWATFNLTAEDRFRIRGGVYAYSLADPQETGLRLTDLSFSYAHTMRLPYDFAVRATVGSTLPTSFYSQRAGLFTAPSGAVSLLGGFAPLGLNVELDGFAGGYFHRYSSVGGYTPDAINGGNPNLKANFGAAAELDYAILGFKQLVFGVDGYVGY